jgi:excisionase family DNA binding protein
MIGIEHDDEESVTVAEAARRLGCATSTVRALAAVGELTGHRVGKGTSPRGVRVNAESIREYKRRHAIEVTPAVAPLPRKRHVSRSDARVMEETLASLRRLGVRI